MERVNKGNGGIDHILENILRWMFLDMCDIHLSIEQSKIISRCAVRFDSDINKTWIKNMILVVLCFRGTERYSTGGPPTPPAKTFLFICDHDKVL